ncbi:ABC transporter ATP-binding protein [Epibacterium ulvae]|uniref:ABC transporter ATP-binding protein n=1 Tax=Epibacterium ulvae TaxID=1156985 RepID=UPI001BFC3DBF|nr:ABC transporter ATP-binding protein [Epibacterium ulvae]MBT8155615.1 ABC transporter ATP-binding protein [Epibacterium ulvae]
MSAADLTVTSVSWGKGRTQPLILHPTSFHLKAGRVMGVVGANGAGKTTLLRMIYRHARPLSGSVQVGGDDIWSMSPRRCARKIAAVLQEQPTDFALTVRDIVALGRIPHKQGFSALSTNCVTVIEASLRRMELLNFADREFGTLSGGERQRVMVARAIAQEPQILVLDEPTNHLDIRNQLEVLKLINDLDITIVTSLHDLNMAASVCDDVLLLHKGRQMAFGCPTEVLSSDRVSDAFGVRAEVDWLSRRDHQHLTFALHSSD